MGIPSTYYRWKHQLDRYDPGILRPRERRTARMANQTSPLTEQRHSQRQFGQVGRATVKPSCLAAVAIRAS
jgi:hypothetical protein